jgi:prepilin-type N-terminal cleavage/methylation domain-containing protein
MVLNRARRFRGFTLIELLVASTMLAVLIVGVSGYLRTGINVWRRLNTDSEKRQRQYVALDRLKRDLEHAMVIDAREEAYGLDAGTLPRPLFGGSQMDWYAVHPGGPARPSAEASWVSYWCADSHEGQAGLWRLSLPLAAARARLDTEPALLLPGCEALQLRYAYQPSEGGQGLDWRETWAGGLERLPALVEVRITLAGGDSVRQVLALPSGVLIPFAESPAP